MEKLGRAVYRPDVGSRKCNPPGEGCTCAVPRMVHAGVRCATVYRPAGSPYKYSSLLANCTRNGFPKVHAATPPWEVNHGMHELPWGVSANWRTECVSECRLWDNTCTFMAARVAGAPFADLRYALVHLFPIYLLRVG